ncbi:MAG: pyrimidine 5'-nucleotidase [Syntrophaceae bacterium]
MCLKNNARAGALGRRVLLDVDDTLYPKGKGPFRAVSARIETFVMTRLDLNRAATKALRADYIRRYGSTLAGLMHEHAFDPDDFLRDVHDVPVESILSRDERLAETLASIALPCIAFSNGSRAYIRRVLETLGVNTLFSGMFAIEDMDYIPKPKPEGYRKLIEFYDVPADSFIMVDDRHENVRTALSLGMYGIVVDQDTHDEIPVIPDIYALPLALAQYLKTYAQGLQG